jgi:hypothetical protein
MAEGYPLLQLFYDLTENEVLAIRDDAIALIAEGKTLLEVTSGGKTGRKQFTLPPAHVLFEARAALKHINPAEYGRRRRRLLSRVPYWPA